jgi:glutathione synthase/RimK-type ligase-like ATP-grasp enzyme
MTENRAAIVTFERLPNLSPDDQLLQRELTRFGVAVEAVVWSDSSVDWSKFSSIVIRSCWDYHHRHEAFLEWLAKIEALGLSIWNRPNLIRWNIDKVYLRELQEMGFRIPPTVWVDKGNSIDLMHVREVLRSQGWRRAVLKPRVSASGHSTILVGEELVGQAQVDAIFRLSGGLIQEYLDVVTAEGEWSLLFFNKKYSHAVLKRPKTGEFRTQIEHGGSFYAAAPPRDYVEVAQNVVTSIEGPLLFARVDGIGVGGKFTLMELELIEPYLFLSLAESAAPELAKAFLDIYKL